MRKNTYTIGSAILIALSLAGVVIMGYLLSLHFSPDAGAFCNLGEGLSCDIVNKSIYAKVLGIPMSLLGLLYFVGVFILALWKKGGAPYNWIALTSLIFLGPSLYLTGIEIFVLKNICVFCEASKVLIAGIMVTGFVFAGKLRPNITQTIIAITLAVFLGWVTYYAHASIVPKGTYTVFAKCVYESGMRMYGSLGCSVCAKQRALLGDAAEHLQEIECDPRYPNPQTDLCIEKNITRTPTWIHEDEEGKTLKKFEPGVLSLKKLSEETGCVLP